MMKKKLNYLMLAIFFSYTVSGNYLPDKIEGDSICDGPYITKEDQGLTVKWIENNILREDQVLPGNFAEIKKNFNLTFDYEDLSEIYSIKPEFSQSYDLIDSIGIISDIHGEYNSYINLLTGNGIIDKDLNWKFGQGHLVVLGDIFDRGDMATEVLWHLFGLEKQALKAGGMVHFLLGNHELMVLNQELGYLSEKYRIVETISENNYSDLYSCNSVLGRWMRSKPVIIAINNIIFVHGGISMDMINRNLKIKDINRIFSKKIIGLEGNTINKKGKTGFLSGIDGPLWYRGYFTDPDFNEVKIDSILKFYRCEHIVVGHTINDEIMSFYNNKILGADTGLMLKQPGEMIIYKGGDFFKAGVSGTRIKL